MLYVSFSTSFCVAQGMCNSTRGFSSKNCITDTSVNRPLHKMTFISVKRQLHCKSLILAFQLDSVHTK